MAKAFVRAIGVFGGQAGLFDKYEEPSYPIDNFNIERSYGGIEHFLREHATPVVDRQVDPLPHLGDGIISGPNACSVYSFNDCLVAHYFESGNGFNFSGVYQCLMVASLREEIIQQTFDVLKQKGDLRCLDYWEENQKFTGEVEVATDQDLVLLLKQ